MGSLGGGCWSRVGSVLSQPARLQTDLPPDSEGPSFHKSSESFLLSHPSFQTCFLLGLQTYSHSSYLLPLSLTSECLLWLPLSPARSLLRFMVDTQQKNAPSCKPAQTHWGGIVFFLL